MGLAVSVAASLVNLGVALVLLRVSRQRKVHHLEANAHHLMTDVWTSVGVLVGVGAVGLTGFLRLDPIIAMIVAGNIVFTAVGIVRKAVSGLMDVALPVQDLAAIRQVLAAYEEQGAQFHALRTRQAGARGFVSVHVLVPGAWTVHDGHQFVERIERDVRQAVPSAHVTTHLESLDDPASWTDESLDDAEACD